MKLPWSTLKSFLEHPWNFLGRPLKHFWNFPEIPFDLLLDTLKTNWKFPWIFLETPLKLSWNTLKIVLKHSWNIPETFFKTSLKHLETLLRREGSKGVLEAQSVIRSASHFFYAFPNLLTSIYSVLVLTLAGNYSINANLLS